MRKEKNSAAALLKKKMKDIHEKAYIFGSVFTLSNKLQALGDKFDRNLTIKQWLLLAGIFQSGSDAPTIGEVARLTGNSRQNAKKMLLRLEKEGFVTLQKDPDDARMLRASLTEKCRTYFKQREKSELEFLEQVFNGLDSDLIKSLAGGISRLEANIIEMEKQCVYEEEE